MIRRLVLLLFFPLSALAQAPDDELVNVRELIPDILLDQKYSTLDNFFQQKLYSTNECLLTMAAVKKLKIVQDSLRVRGLGLKIWDGYRPRAVQYLMWEILPNPTYVADPGNGSKHNRGSAIDLTLVTLATGQEVPMPTPFDWFGPEAAHDYISPVPAANQNRALLRDMMLNVGGFVLYQAEWWHYELANANSYPLLDFQMK